MNANIEQNTDNALQTETIALKVASDIIEGNKAVDITVESMKETNKKIKKNDKVKGVFLNLDGKDVLDNDFEKI